MVLGGDSGEIVPLEITRLSIVKVDGFSERIVAGVESSSVVVESVGEDQAEFWPIVEGGPHYLPIRSAWVYETSVAWESKNTEPQLEINIWP